MGGGGETIKKKKKFFFFFGFALFSLFLLSPFSLSLSFFFLWLQINSAPTDPPSMFEAWENELFRFGSTTALRVPADSEYKQQASPDKVHEDELRQISFPQTVQVGDQKFCWAGTINSGTNGRIELFRNDELKRDLAVKITLNSESSVVNKLNRSKKTCAQIPVREVEGLLLQQEPVYYLYAMPVMEDSLHNWLQPSLGRKNKHSLVLVAELIRQQVVCLLEVTGVPYLDLKPDNVLYRQNKEGMSVHVADLGSLTVVSDPGEIISTYPPPEFRSGIVPLPESAEEREKLLSWSVGVLLLLFFDFELVDEHLHFSENGEEEEKEEEGEGKSSIKAVIEKGQKLLMDRGIPEEVVHLLNFEASTRTPVSSVQIRIEQTKKRKKMGNTQTSLLTQLVDRAR